jgi:hypothetical protein
MFLPRDSRGARIHALIGLSGVSQRAIWQVSSYCFAAIEAILHTVVRDANALVFIPVSMP